MPRNGQGCNGLPKPKVDLPAVGQYVSIAGGIAVSLDSGAGDTTNLTYTTVTLSAVSLTTVGRPVSLSLMPSNPGTPSFFKPSATGGFTLVLGKVGLTRNGTLIYDNIFGMESAANITDFRVAVSSISAVDFPPAGNHNYQVVISAVNTGGTTPRMAYESFKLVAYEL